MLSSPSSLASESVSGLLPIFKSIRAHTESICSHLLPEDFVVQPAEFVSPPKWHLAHTTWFFETFLLLPHLTAYEIFDENFSYIFNSYYESVGQRVLRAERGNLSRPATAQVYAYRKYVDAAVHTLLESSKGSSEEIEALLELGMQHEMQHQELLYSDIKYILGNNPLQPHYSAVCVVDSPIAKDREGWIKMPEGIYEIGHEGEGFSFDNEHGRHKVFLPSFAISEQLVTVGEYLEFINAGGYSDFRHWHSDGWAWVQAGNVKSPLYMHLVDGKWHRYTLAGVKMCDLNEPIMHVNFYEASAFAAWKGERLPTEQEWEAACPRFKWGSLWEWTGSAYLPYPGYQHAPGAIGEYNGKFMVNQMVLRGASGATYPGHSRASYRNFFQAQHQWQFTGIRTARSI